MSRYFNAIEAKCKDGTFVPPEYLKNFERIASQADVIREMHGSAVEVVSGYRTPAWNKGAKESQHLTASALDLRPFVIDWGKLDNVLRLQHVEEFYKLILILLRKNALPLIGGVGYYPGKWVHIDCRARKPSGVLYAFASSVPGHFDGSIAV